MGDCKPADVAKTGLAEHPRYFAAKVQPGMKVPADTRLLRHVKLNELPTYLSKQNWSPLGMWYFFKRGYSRWYTTYFRVRNMKGFGLAQVAAVLAIGNYCIDHEYISRTHQNRKYH